MYKVYDDYECNMELIGTATTLEEVKKLAKDRYYETDGECCIFYGTNKKDAKIFLKTF